MKKVRVSLLILGILAVFSFSACSDGGTDEPVIADYELVIFQTNDRHSHFLGLPNGDYDPSTTGDGTVGGAARWFKLIDAERASGADVLLLDAGDFTQGTMLTTADNLAADLNFMKEIGYAAATIGNHELDKGPAVLADMINNADQPTIPLLATNINFNKDKPGDDSLAALYGNQGEAGKSIFPYITLETPSGIKVGIIGLLGLDAHDNDRINALPLYFSTDMEEMAETAQNAINTLRDDEKVDLVLCLAHLGVVWQDNELIGESVDLAKLTTGIDIILSGHAHTLVDEAVSVTSDVAGSSWSTTIMESGSYGRILGRYDVNRKDGNTTITGSLTPVTDQMETDSNITSKVDDLIADVTANVLPLFPQVPETDAFLDGDFFQVLGHSTFPLTRHYKEPNNLAYMLADAMREISGVDIAAASNGGDLRESLPLSNGDEINLQDAYIAVPLGGGADGKPGYPLVKFYLTLFEVQLLMEATTCDMGQLANSFMVAPSGMRFVCDLDSPLYTRITQTTIYQEIDESDAGTLVYENGTYIEDKTKLYSICTSRYIAEQMTALGVLPRDENGDFTSVDAIIMTDKSGDEIKIWYTFLTKIASFGDNVPEMYRDADNPLGPYWRRAWILNQHPCTGADAHPYCQ